MSNPTEEQKKAAHKISDGVTCLVSDVAFLLADREQPADIAAVTRAVRAADEVFESVGGSSRHYVKECLLPALAAEGLAVVKAKGAT